MTTNPPPLIGPQDMEMDASMKKGKSKEDLLVTDLGQIEPLYNDFDGKMYGASQMTILFHVPNRDMSSHESFLSYTTHLPLTI
jgi:hypothetical protein